MNHAMSVDLKPDGIDSVLVHPGYVSTDMNGFKGWISIDESASGIMNVLETKEDLNARWYAFDGSEIPY